MIFNRFIAWTARDVGEPEPFKVGDVIPKPSTGKLFQVRKVRKLKPQYLGFSQSWAVRWEALGKPTSAGSEETDG